jgi:hypothetical protein
MATVSLGQVVVTPGAGAAQAVHIARCLERHRTGDWGNIDLDDARQNDEHLSLGVGYFMSAYELDPSKPATSHGENCMWIITSGGVTTILLPEEY